LLFCYSLHVMMCF